jgi:hypothetical protein
MAGPSEEGLPIAYDVLEHGVSVLSSDEREVGTVHHVVAAPEKDIFHGLVISTKAGRRFVEAASVGALHERRVDLRIDAAAVEGLPKPGGGAPVFREDPAAAVSKGWSHWVGRLAGRRDWHRDA